MKKMNATLAMVAACAVGAQAAVSLPDLFGDHALVQRDAATAVWGRGDPGERVTVTLGGRRTGGGSSGSTRRN